MPVTLKVGQTVVVTVTESNASGDVPVVPANLVFSIDNEAIATIVSNGDGTATITAVAEGTANEAVNDTAFGLQDTQVITVEAVGPPPNVPTAIAQSFGTPTP